VDRRSRDVNFVTPPHHETPEGGNEDDVKGRGCPSSRQSVYPRQSVYQTLRFSPTSSRSAAKAVQPRCEPYCQPPTPPLRGPSRGAPPRSPQITGLFLAARSTISRSCRNLVSLRRFAWVPACCNLKFCSFSSSLLSKSSASPSSDSGFDFFFAFGLSLIGAT
jgi:hypothetical protein